ncbi:MAG: type II toxin-antitoxin system RelE/ParE family toxin [Bacteroidales bacterium]|nr:type II toxin-antitoxin system RelE/ParE family toxin [Bacteroidales bacterium]MCF8455149.1 type II toxin-antitoxin system RelE/ParE family toxin [Bacteroidales bacterium]
MEIRISPFAELDLEESVEFYNLQKEGLGHEFAQVVSDIIERIKQNPFQFPNKYLELRKAKMKGFPFNVFFVEKENVGYILAVFHSSRNPKIIKQRYRAS